MGFHLDFFLILQFGTLEHQSLRELSPNHDLSLKSNNAWVEEGWGTKVIKRLATDLKQEFPNVGGYSSLNLKYMRAFAEAYPDEQIMQRIAAQIPWRHNQILLDKLKSYDKRLWYAQQSLENGWSRNILVLQIESDRWVCTTPYQFANRDFHTSLTEAAPGQLAYHRAVRDGTEYSSVWSSIWRFFFRGRLGESEVFQHFKYV